MNTFSEYKQFLKKAKELGFKFFPLKDHNDFENADRAIIIRHDVDLLPKNAWEFAKIEQKLGIQASYFVRLHGKYNPFDYENFKYFKNISKDHEIGLHLEPEFANIFEIEQKYLYYQDMEVLDVFDSSCVLGAVIHEPNRTKNINFWPKYDEFCLSKGEYVDCEHEYLSDSWGRHHELILQRRPNKTHLIYNFHPEWYYKETFLENW